MTKPIATLPIHDGNRSLRTSCSELAGVDNDYFVAHGATLRAARFNELDILARLHVVLRDPAEDDVLAVKPARLFRRDEELRPVAGRGQMQSTIARERLHLRIGTGVGH